nr:aldo/keto reductase [Cytophagales bacterium]
MKKRALGKTGLEVSEIAFGGVEIGMPYGFGIHSEAEMLQEKDAIRLLCLALDRGITFYDTARMYGQSESLIGKAFKDKRDQVIISSKCRHLRRSDGSLPNDSELPEIISTSLEESLRELQTDYLDLFMLHQADVAILENEAIREAFLRLKASGKVRAIGASTYSVEETTLAIEDPAWEVVQLPFNLLDQRQGSLFRQAEIHGVGIVIRSVLLRGLLSDRGKNLPQPLLAIEQHIQSYSQLAENGDMDLPTLAIKFALAFPEVSSVLVGIDKESYLLHALAAGKGTMLNKRQIDEAKALAYPDPEFINLPVWDRNGWLT